MHVISQIFLDQLIENRPLTLKVQVQVKLFFINVKIWLMIIYPIFKFFSQMQFLDL